MAKFVALERSTGPLSGQIFVNPLTVTMLLANGMDQTRIIVVGSGEPILVQGPREEVQRRLEDGMK